jgi:VanZ family protein
MSPRPPIRWLRLVAPLSVMAVIFILSGRPAPADLRHGADLVVHVLVFGWLCLTWIWALEGRTGLACVLTATYGLVDEWHQWHTPGRHASVSDVCADLFGAVLAAVLWSRIRPAA